MVPMRVFSGLSSSGAAFFLMLTKTALRRSVRFVHQYMPEKVSGEPPKCGMDPMPRRHGIPTDGCVLPLEQADAAPTES
mgnify:CR=1 FL=1